MVEKKSVGRITVKDVGYIDISDKRTYEIAKLYFKTMAKKVGIDEPDLT